MPRIKRKEKNKAAPGEGGAEQGTGISEQAESDSSRYIRRLLNADLPDNASTMPGLDYSGGSNAI